MRFSKSIVILIILLVTAFTIAVLYIFNNIGSEPTVLIGAWFAFATGELAILAGIKKNEDRIPDNNNNNNSDNLDI